MGAREAVFAEVVDEKGIPVAEAWCSWVLDEREETPMRRMNTLPAIFYSSGVYLTRIDLERLEMLGETGNVTKSRQDTRQNLFMRHVCAEICIP